MRNILIWSAAALCLTAATVAAQQAEPKRKTVARNPSFTLAQAERGSQAYGANCVSCHLAGLDGADHDAAPNRRATPLYDSERFVRNIEKAYIALLG